MRHFILNRCWSWNLPPWTCDAGPGSLWDTEGAQRLSYLLGVLQQAPGVCQVSSIYNQHRGHPSLLTRQCFLRKTSNSSASWKLLVGSGDASGFSELVPMGLRKPMHARPGCGPSPEWGLCIGSCLCLHFFMYRMERPAPPCHPSRLLVSGLLTSGVRKEWGQLKNTKCVVSL